MKTSSNDGAKVSSSLPSAPPAAAPPRSNAERTGATQAALIAAARELFVRRGYADTSTPEIVAAAGVTRGALYHHYADKAELFYAVALQAADDVAADIERGSARAATPLQALIDGAESYFVAMSQAGRARLLLLDAPAVLAPERLLALSARAGAGALLDGLRAALAGAPGVPDDHLPALASLLSAAFDRAALAIAHGEPSAPYQAAMRVLLTRLAGGAGTG